MGRLKRLRWINQETTPLPSQRPDDQIHWDWEDTPKETHCNPTAAHTVKNLQLMKGLPTVPEVRGQSARWEHTDIEKYKIKLEVFSHNSIKNQS